MQCVRRLQVAWMIQEWKKINWGRFERWSALRCENDYQGQSEGYFIYTDLKNVNQTWCFKATEFKIYRNDIGALRQHIEFSRRFYSVANSAGKVDRNCEL